jgi:hypothetical protein
MHGVQGSVGVADVEGAQLLASNQRCGNQWQQVLVDWVRACTDSTLCGQEADLSLHGES